MRTLLILSLIANVLLGVFHAGLHAEHGRLLAFACEHGNGGAECGEM